MDEQILQISIIGLLGVGSQWLAWRLNLPGIVLMAIAGLVAGPGLQILAPEQAFGELYKPMISLAVAVILFEGGLSLDFAELRGVSRGVMRLIFPGVLFSWALGALAAHYIGGFAWSPAILFAGLLIVTGPTVIIPLLRQAKLGSRASALLKWEGIVNDPVGAMLAVVVFEVATLGGSHEPTGVLIASFALGAIISVAFGWGLGAAVAAGFRRGLVPEYLKAPLVLVVLVVAFALANQIQEEAGLISVTAMGVALANAKIASINDMRRFKETVTILLVSGVFVMLTANLSRETLALLDWRAAAFVAAMLFLVRPVAVFASMIRSDATWSERSLVAWIAPRGIVAVAVSEFFGSRLVDAGYPDGELLVPFAFAMVFATVVLHGFTIGPLAKRLGLAHAGKPGVLIVGASPFSVSLASKLKEMGETVLVADSSWRRLRGARQADIQTYYGEILSEATEHHLDLNKYGLLLAVGGNEAHNALVATDLAPEFGRNQVYQLSSRAGDEDDRRAVSHTLQGKSFLRSGLGLDDLLRRHYAGWTFQRTRLTEEFGPESLTKSMAEDAMIVAVVKKSGELVFRSEDAPLKPATGDTVLVYGPPGEAGPKRRERKDDAAGEPDQA